MALTLDDLFVIIRKNEQNAADRHAELVRILRPKDALAEVPKVCPKGHLMTPDNVVIEKRQGHPKKRCRICRQESWKKNSAKRNSRGLHT